MRRLGLPKARRRAFPGVFARWGHSESWPDGTPKPFRGKEAWKNWINWDAPFREESDELNRQRKFFWEVDDKGALWRIELCEMGRFGQMKHPKVVDDLFSHLQRNRTGEFPSFPFVSLKTHEHYYVRWANPTARLAREVPIVFNDFRDGYLVHLVDQGLAKSLSTCFDPRALRLTLRSGRLLHPVSTQRKARQSDGSSINVRETSFLASLDVATSQQILSLCEEVDDVASGFVVHWEKTQTPLLVESE